MGFTLYHSFLRTLDLHWKQVLQMGDLNMFYTIMYLKQSLNGPKYCCDILEILKMVKEQHSLKLTLNLGSFRKDVAMICENM